MGKVLIIGAGGVGRVVVHKCAQNPDVFTEIALASRTKEKCDAIAAEVVGVEGQRRILHAAKGEARREDQHVVPTPFIGPVKRLRGIDHPFRVAELGRRLVEHRWFGPHAGTRAKRTEFEVTDRDGDQVRRDRVLHAEAEFALVPLQNRLADRGALITAVSSAGTLIVASQLCRIPGESWVGIQVRFSIDWPWLSRNGCFLPAVCSGVSHCSAPVTHGKKSGTGLGMAVARRFVEDHGGRIELLPEGPGARFEIRLPLEPAL